MQDIMDTTISHVVTKVDRFKDEVMFESELESAFHCFITHSAEDEANKFKRHQESLKNMFSSFSKEEMTSALAHYADILGSIPSNQKLRVLFALLEYGVNENFIPSRLVCESLLKSESLVYTNEDFWCMSFVLMDKIISTLDYKGIRDVLKCILLKVNEIKSSFNVSVLNQLRAVQKVLDRIFDRNNCLLPSYLILEELVGLPNKGCHWKFSKLLSSFVDSFRPVAQMVSLSVLMNIRGEECPYGKSKLLPIIGHSATHGASVWKMDYQAGRVILKGSLPYSKELLETQHTVLRYVLEQPGSRDMIFNMLGITNMQSMEKCPVLIEQLCALTMTAMEKTENEAEPLEYGSSLQMFWQHLATQMINFGQYEFANIIEIINILCERLSACNLRKGRDHLMWVLLLFLSGSINKCRIGDSCHVLKIYDLLYPEKEPLPLPDPTKYNFIHKLSAVSIWIHLLKKAQTESTYFNRKLPVAMTAHAEFVQRCLSELSQHTNDFSHSLNSDFRIPLLCNAYSTSQEYFTKPMTVLVESVDFLNKQNTGMSSSIPPPYVPLPMYILDSLSTHTKMSLVTTFVSTITKGKQNDIISHALAETYSRLLASTELESFGIRRFFTAVIPNAFYNHAWNILHALLEICSYRLHHFPAHYRLIVLNHLHTLANNSHVNHIQFHLCVESTALKLISGMGSADVQPQLADLFAKENVRKVSLLSFESEELSKVLVLTIARAIHITGSQSVSSSWCKEIMTFIMQHAPHSWSSSTLKCFPAILAEFYAGHPTPKDNRAQLKRSVEEEYRKWKTMSNENDIISHFSLQGSSPLFLCLLWKMLLDNDHISTKAYKILDRIGPRSLAAHLRTFADFLVFEFSISAAGQHVNKYIDALNDLVWKCHVIQIDRLILCLALRTFEGNEAQVCFLIIQMLLLRPQEFKSRVYDFVKNSPEHWKQSDTHEKNLVFQRMYEEKFYFEGLIELNSQSSQHTYLPVYFGNVCLRFLPVMDIILHRFIELPGVSMSLEPLLESLGCLYKFHDRPLTYLYNTLHYYEQKLKDRPLLKKQLVSAIVGSFKDVRPKGWGLSEGFLNYLQDSSNDLSWVPDSDYYVNLVARLVDTVAGKPPFPPMDWRFNEFQNVGAHALHVTCIELMAIPNSSVLVGNGLLDVVLKMRTTTVNSNIVAWMNAIGLVLTALPVAFWDVFYDRIVQVLQQPLIANNVRGMDPFMMFDFATSYNSMTELPCSYMIALAHSIWYHASLGQLCNLIDVFREKFKPAVKTEEQFLFICHLISPFFQRFCSERPQVGMEILVVFFEMLESVDKNCEELKYIDPVCDLLYHIKSNYTREFGENEVEIIIRNLRPALYRKLQFIIPPTVVKKEPL